MVGQRFARVNASLASARRSAALTRAIRRPTSSYRRASHVSAASVGDVLLASMTLDMHAYFESQCSGHDRPKVARIVADNIPRRTQDVNDPDSARGAASRGRWRGRSRPGFRFCAGRNPLSGAAESAAPRADGEVVQVNGVMALVSEATFPQLVPSGIRDDVGAG
jgi:hypothetical protein